MVKNTKSWLDRQSKRFKILVLLYFLLLTWLLLRPGGEGGAEILGLDLSAIYNDKIIHGVSFSILTGLGCLAFTKVKRIYLLLISIAYGIAIEFMQEYMAMGRMFEYADVLADTIGGIFGVLIIEVIKKKARNKLFRF